MVGDLELIWARHDEINPESPEANRSWDFDGILAECGSHETTPSRGLVTIISLVCEGIRNKGRDSQ